MQNSMDIWNTKPGDKIRYHGVGGYDLDFMYNKRAGLVVGQVYTVDEIDIQDFYTDIILKEVKGVFNSVMFENVESGPDSTEQKQQSSS